MCGRSDDGGLLAALCDGPRGAALTMLAALVLSTAPAHAGTGADLFIRGDSNSDGLVDISDAVFSLSALFTGGPQPDCLDAADANDDGTFDISDAVSTLNALFVAGAPLPPAPYPMPGVDPTPDGVVCSSLVCVEPIIIEGLITAAFPVELCVPPSTISDPLFTVDTCGSMDCLGGTLVGCTLTLEVTDVTYDVTTHTLTFNGTGTIDPLATTITSFIGTTTTCDVIVTGNFSYTAEFESETVAPGIDQIISQTFGDAVIDSVDVDGSACGFLVGAAIDLLAGSLIDSTIPTLEAEAEVQIAAAVETLLLSAPVYVCTP